MGSIDNQASKVKPHAHNGRKGFSAYATHACRTPPALSARSVTSDAAGLPQLALRSTGSVDGVSRAEPNEVSLTR